MMNNPEKKMKTIIPITAILLMVLSLCADGEGVQQRDYSVGYKVWQVSGETYLSSSEGEGQMQGVHASASVSSNVWISAMLIQGDFETEGWTLGGHVIRGYKEEALDSEILIGTSLDLIDIGVGVRYLSTIESRDEKNWINKSKASGYGPMIYLGKGHMIKGLPIGLYGGATWTPVVYGEHEWIGSENEELSKSYADRELKASHYNIETGGFIKFDSWSASVGYRIRQFLKEDFGFDEAPQSISGVTAELACYF